MTAIIAIENNDNLDSEVTITKDVFYGINEYAQVGLKMGDKVTYRDLLYGVLLPSGADAVNAIVLNTTKTKEEFMKVLEVNVVGTFLVTKYSLSIMNNGLVINMSSLDGYSTFNEYNMDYSVSKAGVNMLSKCFSISNLDNKFVSVMLPWIKTESTLEIDKEFLNSELKRTKQKRLVEAYEVALKIYELTLDKNIKSGSIITMEFD